MKNLIYYLAVLAVLTKITISLCIKNCLSCSDTNSCSQCKSGYFLASTQINSQCKPCPQNCAICSMGSDGIRTCTQCVQNAQKDANNRCFFCDPKCRSCSESPTNCSSCVQGFQLFNSFLQATCVKSQFCGLKNCLNCTTENDNLTYCNDCQNGFCSFRKGCDRCSLPCSTCSLDIESLWNNQILNFWVTMKSNLISKIQSTRRLLTIQRPIDPIYNNSEQNDYPPDSYSESYLLWNMSTWNSTSWTSDSLNVFSNMSEGKVRGWTEAYFLFKTVEPYFANLTNLIYRCLPLMSQLLKMTEARSGQWNHIARFISNVTNLSWTGRNLENKFLEKSSSKTVCISCQIGYYYISQNKTCQACRQNCQTCSSQTNCNKCVQGYYILDNFCAKCSQNCEDCSQRAENCTKCKKQAYLSQGKCLTCKQQCNGCSQNGSCIKCNYPYSAFPSSNSSCYKCKQQSCENCLQANISKCLECRDGFRNTDNGTCVQCSMKNCMSCHLVASRDICIECFDGYLLINNTCVACGPGCIEGSYINTSKCIQCDSGKYLSPIDSTCQLCPKYCKTCNQPYFCNQYLPGFVKYKDRIVQCSPGCNRCSSTNPSICLQCDDKYFLQQGNCRRCGKFCKTCTNSSSCLTCADSTPSCLQCSGNCLTCSSSSPSVCTACRRGYKLVDSGCLLCMEGCSKCQVVNNVEICTKCNPNFALQLNGTCIKCLQSCYGHCDSTNITKCLSCSIGFQYTDKSCRPCPKGCTSCYNSQCLTCQQNYRLIETQTNNFVCTKKCKHPCIMCQQQVCLTCASGYILNNVTKSCAMDISCNPRCQYCLSGSYLNTNSNSCVLCSSNCAKCTSSECVTCQPGYYLQSNGICTSCVAPCATCFESDQCQSCAEGYVLEILGQNQQLGYVFGDRCLKCDGNCKTCSLVPNRCLSCFTGMILRGVKCVGKYGIKFDFKLNKIYNDFLQNSEIGSFLQHLSTLISVSKHNISLTQIKQGSTQISGHISAQSESAANTKKAILQNTVSLGGTQIISSSFNIVVNNYEEYDNNAQKNERRKKQNDEKWTKIGYIIGSSIGAFAAIVVIIFICYCCIKKRQKTQNQDNFQMADHQPDNQEKYEVMTGFASDNIAIDNQSQYYVNK